MHTTNYLADHSKVIFMNNAIECPGKGMKGRHIPAKMCHGDDGGQYHSRDHNSSIRCWVYLCVGDRDMYY